MFADLPSPDRLPPELAMPVDEPVADTEVELESVPVVAAALFPLAGEMLALLRAVVLSSGSRALPKRLLDMTGGAEESVREPVLLI